MNAASIAPLYFTREEIEDSRRYNRPLMQLRWGVAIVNVTYFTAVCFTGLGRWLEEPIAHVPRAQTALYYPAIVVGGAVLLRLPLALAWYSHQSRTGVWRQSPLRRMIGWLARAIWLGGSAAILLQVIVDVAGAHPIGWPLLLGPPVPAFLVLAITLGSYLAPIWLHPFPNQVLLEELRTLANRAGVKFRSVLVRRASGKGSLESIFTVGLGPLRRVIIDATLLSASSPREVNVLFAHELGHLRAHDSSKKILLLSLGAALTVLLCWLAFRSAIVLHMLHADGPGDPRVAPLVLLVVQVGALISLPARSSVSRRQEASADRFAVELTGDGEALASALRRLAVTTRELLAPRRSDLWLKTHPPAPLRIEEALRQHTLSAADPA